MHCVYTLPAQSTDQSNRRPGTMGCVVFVILTSAHVHAVDQKVTIESVIPRRRTRARGRLGVGRHLPTSKKQNVRLPARRAHGGGDPAASPVHCTFAPGLPMATPGSAASLRRCLPSAAVRWRTPFACPAAGGAGGAVAGRPCAPGGGASGVSGPVPEARPPDPDGPPALDQGAPRGALAPRCPWTNRSWRRAASMACAFRAAIA